MHEPVLRFIGKEGEQLEGADGTPVPPVIYAFALAKYQPIIDEQQKLTGKKLYEPVKPAKPETPAVSAAKVED